ETADHDEDWFVTARDRWTAARCFEAHEGYDDGDCTATWVADLPAALVRQRGRHAHYASKSEITQCGGVFVPLPPADDEHAVLHQQMGVVREVVRFGSRTFTSGDIVANMLAEIKPRAKH